MGGEEELMTMRLARAGSVLLVLAGAVVTPAVATGQSSCRAAKAPVEAATLVLEITPDKSTYRRGERVKAFAVVTRIGPAGSPEAQLGGAAPIELALVTAELFLRKEALDFAGQETNKRGEATLLFNVPETAPFGPVGLSGGVRYVTVDSFDCTGPVLVETGETVKDRFLTVSR